MVAGVYKLLTVWDPRPNSEYSAHGDRTEVFVFLRLQARRGRSSVLKLKGRRGAQGETMYNEEHPPPGPEHPLCMLHGVDLELPASAFSRSSSHLSQTPTPPRSVSPEPSDGTTLRNKSRSARSYMPLQTSAQDAAGARDAFHYVSVFLPGL